MPKRLSSLLCASALFLGSAGMAAMMPVTAQAAGIQVGFNFFHDRLAASGRWIHHPVWGDVWRPRPRLVGADFQPYSNGHWELTDEYGWYWVSDDPFDDVVYHYGRWVYDPQAHWLWVPGYTWAPAWVSWRESDDYTGWMPLPPDESFISGTAMSFGVELGPVGIDFYRKWYGGRVDPDRFYVFVGNAHLVDRDYRRFVVPRERVVTIINRTRPVTRFEIVNDRVVNRGVDVRIIERASGHRIAPVSAKIVVKPNAVITTVGEAKQIGRASGRHILSMRTLRGAAARWAAAPWMAPVGTAQKAAARPPAKAAPGGTMVPWASVVRWVQAEARTEQPPRRPRTPVRRARRTTTPRPVRRRRRRTRTATRATPRRKATAR